MGYPYKEFLSPREKNRVSGSTHLGSEGLVSSTGVSHLPVKKENTTQFSSPIISYVFYFSFYCCDKYQDQRHLGEIGVYFTYILQYVGEDC